MGLLSADATAFMLRFQGVQQADQTRGDAVMGAFTAVLVAGAVPACNFMEQPMQPASPWHT